MIENVSDSQPYSLLRAALELQKIIRADFEHPGFGLVHLYLQQNINHREIHNELDNYKNWPLHMFAADNNHVLKQQVKNLKRLCMVRNFLVRYYRYYYITEKNCKNKNISSLYFNFVDAIGR